MTQQELNEQLASILARFRKEAKRLHDPTVLSEGRNILVSYFTCLKQLGTIEHEVALRTLAEQIKIVSREASASRSSLWKRVWMSLKRRPSRTDRVIKDAISNARNLLDDKDLEPEMDLPLRDLIESAEAAATSQKQGESLSWEFEDTLLAFDARVHWGMYTRLGVQRVISFVGKHAFVVAVPVLLAGIGYSWVVRQGQTFVQNAFRFGFWGIVAILLLPAMFKEYFLAKWIRTVRLRVERRLLLPVVYSVFQARLVGFVSATRARQPLGG
jgi:hypothetical protein